MAIDYAIRYACLPRRHMDDAHMIALLKERERAEVIIRTFRANGDDRPPSEMGFEFTRTTPQGEEATELHVVQDVLDRVAELDAYASACAGCPANLLGQAYGCANFIQYPLSGAAEAWLLNQLPTPGDALLWLLLKQGVEEFMYDGHAITQLRQQSENYFQDRVAASRKLGEFDITADQVFEMMFSLQDDIQPNHAGILLLFFHAIPRDFLDAHDIMHIAPAPPDALERFPFLHTIQADDDKTIRELKQFFRALYQAWVLNVPLFVDA